MHVVQREVSRGCLVASSLLTKPLSENSNLQICATDSLGMFVEAALGKLSLNLISTHFYEDTLKRAQNSVLDQKTIMVSHLSKYHKFYVFSPSDVSCLHTIQL